MLLYYYLFRVIDFPLVLLFVVLPLFSNDSLRKIYMCVCVCVENFRNVLTSHIKYTGTSHHVRRPTRGDISWSCQ